MKDLSQFFHEQESKPVKVGSQTLTLISKTFSFPFPGMANGLVWNRPAVVRVATDGAGEVELPIIDITRRWELFLAGLALAGIVFGLIFSRRS